MASSKEAIRNGSLAPTFISSVSQRRLVVGSALLSSTKRCDENNEPFRWSEKAMKAIRMIALIALIFTPSASFAWGPRGVVVVRPFFPGRAVAAGFFGGLATGIIFNRVLVSPLLFYPASYGYYYPPSYSYYSYTYPPPYSYYNYYSPPAPPPPASAPGNAYNRGYSDGYSRGYEEAQKELEKERYEEGKKRGYEQGYDAGKGGLSP